VTYDELRQQAINFAARWAIAGFVPTPDEPEQTAMELAGTTHRSGTSGVFPMASKMEGTGPVAFAIEILAGKYSTRSPYQAVVKAK